MTEPMPNQARHVHRLCIALYDDLLAAARVIAEHHREKKGEEYIDGAYAFDEHIRSSIEAIDTATENARRSYRRDEISESEFYLAETSRSQLDEDIRDWVTRHVVDATRHANTTLYTSAAESSVSELQRLRDAAVKRLG